MSETQAEYKVKSFRVDDETFEKFKAISTDVFSNQGQCLSALINLYETENSKATIIERKLEIEDFQTHANKLNELFLMSLQLNQDAEIRIRSEFEKLLESKDRTIIDLQNKNKELTISFDTLDKSSRDMKEENADFINRIIELDNTVKRQENDFAAALSDKDKLNKALTDSCNEKKLEIEELRASRLDAEEQLKSLKKIEAENKRLASELEKLTDEMNKQKEHAEIDKEKSLLLSDKAHQQEIKEVHSQQHEEIKEYINKIEKLQEQLESLRNENMRLSKLEVKTISKVAQSKKTGNNKNP